MAHKRKVSGSLATLNATIDAELMHALRAFADENTDGNVSEALRLLLGQSLSSRGALNGLSTSLEDQGYNAGLRAAKHKANAAIAEALNKLWRR